MVSHLLPSIHPPNTPLSPSPSTQSRRTCRCTNTVIPHPPNPPHPDPPQPRPPPASAPEPEPVQTPTDRYGTCAGKLFSRPFPLAGQDFSFSLGREGGAVGCEMQSMGGNGGGVLGFGRG
ncbi:predicted protein [Plenodomus lingam JN3]|uniref:Predicted protein n=1 Tax=Leptosphaeria maculans (strain JN3 / isolate v23.1.3 / race Av1-4-5-6-7-8) TaxID=985895 RepID=E4ZY40_LEPMJ|nr:predicted protein [Plenodomus lingam JN3]CBX96285.1 predicted protein [Plenodomus lingam JN3]